MTVSGSSDINPRLLFAEFLDRLAAGDTSSEDWVRRVVTHYPDEMLEDIRVDLVRAAIEDDPKQHWPWSEVRREQCRTWAQQLRDSVAK